MLSIPGDAKHLCEQRNDRDYNPDADYSIDGQFYVIHMTSLWLELMRIHFLRLQSTGIEKRAHSRYDIRVVQGDKVESGSAVEGE